MTLPIILAVLVTNIAPDGVNTIITDTETGVIQSTCVYGWTSKEMTLEAELLPKEYRDIPGAFIPDEFRKGSPQTVIIPGADQSYVVMSEAWYADLTNRVAKNEREIAIIRAENEKTEEGRVLYHGPRVSVHVDAEQMKRFLVYDDGFIYKENFNPRKTNSPNGSRAALVPPRSGDGGMDAAAHRSPSHEAAQRSPSHEAAHKNPRYAAALKRREAAKKPVEKTIIHMGGAR